MAFCMIPDYKKPGELKPFVLSPSNMAAYRDCPRRFYGQTVTGEVKWKASKQKSRGSIVHDCLGKACKYGCDKVTDWPDGLDQYFVQQRVDELRARAGKIFIEKDIAIDNNFVSSGWWDEDTILRARADALFIPVQPGLHEVLDFKTGKIWDSDAFQLRVEALITHLIYKVDVVNYSYWYVDQGDTVEDSIDFSRGVGAVADIMALMGRMKQSFADSYFPPTKNKFCAWCDLHQTPVCGL